MKNIYFKLLNYTLIVILLSSINQISAQCNGGTLSVTTGLCSANLATLRLNGHTTGVGVTYQWFFSNDQGLSWLTAPNGSSDTLNIAASLINRIYRCRVTCPTGVAFSPVYSFNLINRSLKVTGKICSPTGLNDSITIALNPLPAISSDSLNAKSILWQSTSTGGAIWNNVATNVPSINVKFNAQNPLTYRALISLCPISQPYPNTPPAATSNMIVAGAKNDLIGITNKNCVNDSARISMASIDSSLRSLLIVRWYESTSSTGPFTEIGSDSAINVKITKQTKYYKSSIKLCSNSKDSSESQVFPIITQLGANTISLNCDSNLVTIDYANRMAKINSSFTYWTVSQNDSLSPMPLVDPKDSMPYSFILNNHTDNYYKIYSKFCPTSTTILDSTFNIHVMLKVDTGQILASYQACPKDSVSLLVKNFNAKSTFPIYNYWEYSVNGNIYDTIKIPNSTDTTAIVPIKPGYSYYRKSIKFCNDKYAKSLYSTVASIYQPEILLSSNFSCSGTNTYTVLNDNPNITDYTGVKPRPAPTSYRWLVTTDNGLTFSLVPGATSATLNVPALCGSTNKYLRESFACSSTTNPNRTKLGFVSVPFSPSVTLNGKTVTTDDICLNDSVNISVINITPVPGSNCEIYAWQTSSDNVTWVDMGVSNPTIKVIVKNSYQYFRRITKYCPSGQTYSEPLALYYNQNLPYCEGFDGQLLFGANTIYTCWRYFSPGCKIDSVTTQPIFSVGSGGRTVSTYQHQEPGNPQTKQADGKLVTPAFKLKRGHIYRISFWHKEDTVNLCWDTLYTTWGHTPNACEINNSFGNGLGRFSFEQWNRFWSDFIPTEDSVYYFGIVYKDRDLTKGNIQFDDICIKEITPCNTASNITKGAVFSPQREIDRNEYPGPIAQNYNKDRVRHQYCIGDTVMLTYRDQNYDVDFDYYGMEYQFYKRRIDQDWHVDDTLFRKIPDSPWWGCHMFQKSAYQTMNVVATDTHTFYKIIATCTLDGKKYEADSWMINGTHSLPYCEDWSSAGSPINVQTSPLPSKNSGQIKIQGPGPRYQNCPTCWASFNVTNVDANNFISTSLPFRAPGPTFIPSLYPDDGYKDRNVVINLDFGGTVLTRKILVFPAVRMHKNRGYRISFRWTDNRQNTQSPFGNISQKTDSLFLIIRDSIHYNFTKLDVGTAKYDTFNKNRYFKQIERNLQSNHLESPTPSKYKTYWYDFSPPDTGTYYIGIAQVTGAGNGTPYRFYMDYFCIDTLSMDDCSKPEFIDPLLVNISPDGVTWLPGASSVLPGAQWCVGNPISLDFNWGQGLENSWKYGWKHLWQIDTINPLTGNPPAWKTIDSSNRYDFVLSYKYRNIRLVLQNKCGDTSIVGPFNILPPGGILPWSEGFENYLYAPPCWDFITPSRVSVKKTKNFFGFGGKCSDSYIQTDYYSPSSGSNLLRTTNTVIPPGFAAVNGVTYRFSFWYMDNGMSQTYDSIKVGWSYSRPTDNFPAANTLVNKVNGSIVKNSKEGKWRYYTAEFTANSDSAVHFKVRSYVNPAFATYFLLYDNFRFKPKYTNDALIIAIDSPDKSCNLNANSTLKIKVMNIGTATQPNIPIQYSINGGAPVSAVVPGPVPSNGVVTYNLTGVDLSAFNTISVLMWTNLVNDQDRGDDTFCTNLVHVEQYNQPIDTGTSICKYKNLQYVVNTPNTFARWYKKSIDTIPFMIGDTIRIDSFQNDTCYYVSASNSAVCYTSPYTISQGVSAFSSATEGLFFNNLSKDTLVIDSFTYYNSNLGTGTVTLSQYGVLNVNGNAPVTLSPTTTGKQIKKLGWKIPPGTDFKITYTGNISLAYLKNYLFQSTGCPTFNFDITANLNPAPALPQYSYFFNMKLISPGCESPKTKVCFTANPNPVFTLKDTNRVCQLPQYQVKGPQAPAGDTYTYLWNINNATTDSIPAVNTGIYQLTVTNKYGCTFTDNVDIVVDPSPLFNLGANQSFCRNTPFVIQTGLDSNSNTVVWNNGGAGVNLSVLNPGTYIATAYNTVNFCSAKDTITLTRLELPTISLGNDRVVCGNSVDLGTTLTNTSLNYLWDNNSTSRNRVVSNSGTYWVKATDPSTGCSVYDTVVVNLKPSPVVNLGPDSVTICGTTTVLSAPAGNYYYLWNTTATTSSINVSTPGRYFVTVSNPTNGCSSVDSIKVNFHTLPVFDLGSNVIKNCNSSSYTLSSPITSNLFTYKWNLPDGTSQTTSSINATKSGVYYLTIGNGCYTYKDSVRLVFNGNISGAIDLLQDTVRACNATTLTATTTPSAGNINWGNPLNVTTNTVYITQSGSYPVSISNECGSSTKSVLVIIDKIPVADFKVDTPSPMSVGLTNLSTYAQNTYWTFGDDSSSTQTNPVHFYQYEGSYVVTLQVSNTCGTRYKSINIPRRYKKGSNPSSSIAALGINDAEIILYPNPTGNKTQLFGKGMPNGSYKISVINTLGQTVMNNEVKIHNGTLDITIDANNYANGEYLIKIESEKETVVKKLVVAK